MTDAVICCIALQEEKYIMEWIKYHLKLGFSKIYIYDNSQNFDMPNFFQNIDENIKNKLVLIHFPGRGKQIEAYENFRVHHSKKHEWVAVIDIDEFIVLEQPIPITSFLQKYCPSGALGLNWRLFGSNGHITYSDEPVTSRFTMAEEKANLHIKTISKCSDLKYIRIHNVELIKGIQKDCLYHPLGESSFNPHLCLDIAYINHYFVKSRDEWTIKRLRGRVDGCPMRLDKEFDIHNKNEVIDTKARDFYLDETLDFSVI